MQTRRSGGHPHPADPLQQRLGAGFEAAVDRARASRGARGGDARLGPRRAGRAGGTRRFLACWMGSLALLACLAPWRAAPAQTRRPGPAASPPGADAAAGDSVARHWSLARPLLRVVDGDTLDVDLDGNGRLEPPGERLRLLFIDTPELHSSPKGQDLAHGLPAKAALERLVAGEALEIRVLQGNERDRYGRTLALLQAGTVQVNLELIRLGHTPFDARFAFPADYDAYVRAEAEAFAAQRGIWGDAPSRRRYLLRLRKEGRTPQAAANPLFVPGVQDVGALDPGRALGRYVIVTAIALERRPLRKGVWLVKLGDALQRTSRTLNAVVFRGQAQRLGVPAWPRAAPLHAEGFIARYKGRFELQLHYARLTGSPSR